MAALNRFPRVVQEFYVERVRQLEAAREARKAAIQTREPRVQVLVYMQSDESWVSRPPRAADGESALVYVPHLSSDADLADEPLVRELAGNLPAGARFFACDVRGSGESQPQTCGFDSFRSPYGCDYFYAIHGIMLDRPYVAQRVHDLLSVLDWLGEHGYRSIQLAARGHGAVPATLAAVLDDRVERVTLKNALTSFAELAESESYTWPLSALVPDVLTRFDLPDCYAELTERKGLKTVEPWDAGGFQFE